MSKEFYIGVRSDFDTMGKLLGRGILRLNQSLADTLRSAAMEKGIKKTEQRRRLEFFAVSEDELNDLLDPGWLALQKLATEAHCRPLVTVDAEQMSSSLDAVNANYTRRMDRATHRKYKAELAQAMSDCVTVVGTDLNIRKAVQRVPQCPFKPGDLLAFDRRGHVGDINANFANLRVIKAGKKFLQVERLVWKDHDLISNIDWIKANTNNPYTYGKSGCWNRSGYAVPLEGNEHLIEWQPVTHWYDIKPMRRQWTDFIPHTRPELIKKFNPELKWGELIPALCYIYEPPYN